MGRRYTCRRAQHESDGFHYHTPHQFTDHRFIVETHDLACESSEGGGCVSTSVEGACQHQQPVPRVSQEFLSSLGDCTLWASSTESTPIALASAAITAAILETTDTFQDIAWAIGSGKMVPPAAPPCRPTAAGSGSRIRVHGQQRGQGEGSVAGSGCTVRVVLRTDLR